MTKFLQKVLCFGCMFLCGYIYIYIYNKVREYFVYRDDHGLESMAIHLAHHCFSFNIRWI